MWVKHDTNTHTDTHTRSDSVPTEAAAYCHTWFISLKDHHPFPCGYCTAALSRWVCVCVNTGVFVPICEKHVCNINIIHNNTCSWTPPFFPKVLFALQRLIAGPVPRPQSTFTKDVITSKDWPWWFQAHNTLLLHQHFVLSFFFALLLFP